MPRFLLALVLSLLCTLSIEAAPPELPSIAADASAYRQYLDALPKSRTAAELLKEIRKAENSGNVAGTTKMYEELVGLNPGVFKAWLQLSLAWRDTDPTADKALSAAFNAYAVTQSAPEQVEALLVMTSVLRARLDLHRHEYDAAYGALQKAEAALESLEGSASEDKTNPTSTRALLDKTRNEVLQETAEASARIAEIAQSLDKIYAEISGKLPEITIEKMRLNDNRSVAFAPLSRSEREQPNVEFKIEGSEIKACINFTQDLKNNGPSYREYVRIERQIVSDVNDQTPLSSNGKDVHLETVTNFGTEVNARRLCVSNLKAGETYNFILLRGFASKLGANLQNDVELADVRFPNLPSQVTFSARRYILPAYGSGEIPLRVTNLDTFELQLLRITDRTLHRQIALGYINGELPPDEFSDLRDRFSELLWRGTVQMPALLIPNQTVTTLFPARDLLNYRKNWLKTELREHPDQRIEMSSGRRIISALSSNTPGVQGEYFSGVSDFEAAALDLPNPGVYALVTRDMQACTNENGQPGGVCPGKYAVQWFVDTDIGLSFYEGDQNFSVIARSLRSGSAKKNVTVELVTSSNRVLASGVTDHNGVAPFARSLTRGTQGNALAAIMVQATNENPNDFAFLTYGPERLDLSRLNVDGRPLPQGLNAFVTTDRGIYQPGETIELLALVRDANGQAPQGLSTATIRAETRDRTLSQQPIQPQDWKQGGVRASLRLPETARSGEVRVTLSVGGGTNSVVGETVVQVGHIRPDRVAVHFAERGWLARTTAGGMLEVSGNANGQYLFAAGEGKQGAASDLKTETVVRVSAVNTPFEACYTDYTFGRFDEALGATASRQFIQNTDTDGNANLKISDLSIPTSTRPLSAAIEVTLFDEAGPLGSRRLSLPIQDGIGWIGLKTSPRAHPGSVPGKIHLIPEVVLLDANNKIEVPHPLVFELKKENDEYTWEHVKNDWQHKRSVKTTTVARQAVNSADLKGTDDAASNAIPRENCAAPKAFDGLQDIDPGRYILSVTDEQTGRISAVRFQSGAADTNSEQLEPNLFVLTSSKRTYQPNETVELTADVPFDGEILVGFAEGDVEHWESARIVNGVGIVRYTPPASWTGKGIHALATAFRSGAQDIPNAGPNRAIGTTFFRVGEPQTAYSASIGLLNTAAQGFIGPNEKLSFQVCLNVTSVQCSAGENIAANDNSSSETYAVAFVVDEGLLSLTGHLSSKLDPQQYFYSRPRLGIRMMDNYGHLLLKAAGDRPGRLALSNYTSDHIVAVTKGPERLQNGRAAFSFDSPGLSGGRLSVFVIVWSKDFATSSSEHVNVRSHVVIDLGTPDFLFAGDHAVLPLRLENVDFLHEGEFAVRVHSSGAQANATVLMKSQAVPAGAPPSELRVSLQQNRPKFANVILDIPPNSTGGLKIILEIEPLGASFPLLDHTREWSIKLLSPKLSSVETVSFPVQQKDINLNDLVAGLIVDNFEPGTVSVKARFADNLQALLATASSDKRETRAILDELILQGLSLLQSPSAVDATSQKRELPKVIGEILSLQLPDGTFMPYRTIDDPNASERNVFDRNNGSGSEATRGITGSGLLRTASAFEVLSLARLSGYEIPDTSLQAAERAIQKRLVGESPDEFCSFEHLYASLVLVNPGGTDYERVLRITTCDFDDVVARSAAAAVLTRFGLSDKAKVVLSSFPKKLDAELAQIDHLRLAMVLNFLIEARGPPTLINSVSYALVDSDKKAINVPAIAAVTRLVRPIETSKLMPSDLQITGATVATRPGQTGVLETPSIPLGVLRQKPVLVASRTDHPVRGLLAVEGALSKSGESQRLPPTAVRRRVFDHHTGREIDLAAERLYVGQRLAVVLEGHADGLTRLLNPDRGEAGPAEPLILADLLPSAFKIESEVVLGKSLKLPGSLGQLQARGDLRSVQPAPDSWVALIVPESRRPADRPAPADDGARAPTMPESGIEFRQGYLVRVNMAGHFTLPGTAVEMTTSFSETLHAPSGTIEVTPSDQVAK